MFGALTLALGNSPTEKEIYQPQGGKASSPRRQRLHSLGRESDKLWLKGDLLGLRTLGVGPELKLGFPERGGRRVLPPLSLPRCPPPSFSECVVSTAPLLPPPQ